MRRRASHGKGREDADSVVSARSRIEPLSDLLLVLVVCRLLSFSVPTLRRPMGVLWLRAKQSHWPKTGCKIRLWRCVFGACGRRRPHRARV